jgi:hypothetical protein
LSKADISSANVEDIEERRECNHNIQRNLSIVGGAFSINIARILYLKMDLILGNWSISRVAQSEWVMFWRSGARGVGLVGGLREGAKGGLFL